MPETTHPSDAASASLAADQRLKMPRTSSSGEPSRVGAWAHVTFARDKFTRGLKTLLWVVPLTLLIWIYAEREQIVPPTTVTLPIEVASTDPNFIVTLEHPENGQIMATITGPKAKVEDVKDMLQDRGGSSPVRIDVNPKALGAGSRRIDLARGQKLGEDPRFVSNGVTVSGVQPEGLEVRIDPIVEREHVPVVADPNLKTVLPPEFEPKEVTLRGPERVLEAAEARHELVAYAMLTGRPELQKADQARIELKNVQLTVPIHDKDVTIVNHPVVTARVELARPVDYNFPYLPVLVASPYKLLDSFTVQYEPTVKNVTVTGPKDKIDALTRDGASVPKAVFEIAPDLTAGTYKADLKYDLPPGVTVKNIGAADGAPAKIDFTLAPRVPGQ